MGYNFGERGNKWEINKSFLVFFFVKFCFSSNKKQLAKRERTIAGGHLVNMYVLMYVFIFYLGKLTATVEPFLPTPPAKTTENICDNDQIPQTIVIRLKEDHNSKLPNI